MSSHHIVRDLQEPALILADVGAFPFDLLGQLLEWAPYTVCGDAALDQALKYEINLDVVFSDRTDLVDELAHFPSVEIIRPTENWLEEAVLLLATKGHQAVNVVVGDGFYAWDEIHRLHNHMLVGVITPTIKYVRVEQNFSKWLPSGSRIHVIGSENVHMNGRPLTDETIDAQEDSLVHISCTAPFILGETLS